MMADDVAQQEEGITSLHLRVLRKEWRVVCLQLVASFALIWLFLTMTRVLDIVTLIMLRVVLGALHWIIL